MDSGMHFVASFPPLSGNALLKVGCILNLKMAYIIYKFTNGAVRHITQPGVPHVVWGV